jgi:hypothetical protein
MTFKEAEDIIVAYNKAIKPNLIPNAIVQPISDLPCSPCKIMYAHFIYGEHMINEKLLTKEMGDALMQSYAGIQRIFVEDAESINKKYRNYLKELDEGIIPKDFSPSIYQVAPERVLDFNNFLADCQGKWNKGKEVFYIK